MTSLDWNALLTNRNNLVVRVFSVGASSGVLSQYDKRTKGVRYKVILVVQDTLCISSAVTDTLSDYSPVAVVGRNNARTRVQRNVRV